MPTDGSARGHDDGVERSDYLSRETNGLIGAILNNTMTHSEVFSGNKIGFDKLPDANSRLFDAPLRTLLNGCGKIHMDILKSLFLRILGAGNGS
jgi:hypothetical protein